MLGLAGGEFASANEMEGVPRKQMEKEIQDLRDKVKELEEAEPEQSGNPKMEMTTEDRADAWLSFYDNKPDAQKFSKAEERFQKFMNHAENQLSAEVTSNLWDKHDERKVELMV